MVRSSKVGKITIVCSIFCIIPWICLLYTSGTALTEEEEFSAIYKLDVVEIPTNKPMIREDCPDVVYKTEQAKFHAVIDDIVEHHEKGQPVLVGTITIEKSELLSDVYKRQHALQAPCGRYEGLG